MDKKQSSITALISSFGRAYHAQFDEPKIFHDMKARELMSDEEYNQISGYMIGGIDFFAPDKKAEFANAHEALKWVVQTQIAPTPLARAKYCELMLENAVQLGVTQYVLLGAGMDTFAHRNDELLKKIHVYEVDHPNTQHDKRERVKAAGWTIPEHLHYVPMDFTKDSLQDELKKAGFDFSKRTFFSWLGVSYYLTKEQNKNMISSISSFAPKGSSLMFDYADELLFESNVKRVQNMLAMAQAGGEPMKSCFSYAELEKMLEECDFLIYENLTPEDIQQQFFSNRNDDLHAFENIHYALAVLN